jgi:hypothetical protein
MAAGVAARVGDGLIAAMDEAVAAGVDHVYLHQIGPDQAGFLRFWTDEVAPEVRRHATR